MSWYDWAIVAVVVVSIADTVRDSVAAKRQMREWRTKMRELERSQRAARRQGRGEGR